MVEEALVDLQGEITGQIFDFGDISSDLGLELLDLLAFSDQAIVGI